MFEDLKYKIGITFIKGVGPNLARMLIAYTGSVEAVFNESKQSLAKIPGIGTVLSSEIVNHRENALIRAEKEIEFITKEGIQFYFFTDEDYPFRLKECPDAPVLLYGKGKLNLNAGKFVGIVGTRKATEEGKENTRKLVEDLARCQQDITIVSGLAYGIDIYSHKAALDSGLPTIAVLGHGLDRIYPAAHHKEAKKMCERGGLLTEFPSGTNPDRPNFVQRNRIVAGMSDAVVVVESNVKGGSLITANLANDYNRDVFAYPGRVSDEASSGCNSLIKHNKANLIESADDLMRIMNWESDGKGKGGMIQPTLFVELSDDEEFMVDLLRKYPDGVQVNELAVLSGKPFSKVSSLLLELEFKNMVKCLPGNFYRVGK